MEIRIRIRKKKDCSIEIFAAAGMQWSFVAVNANRIFNCLSTKTHKVAQGCKTQKFLTTKT